MKNYLRSLCMVLVMTTLAAVASAQTARNEKAVIRTNIACDHCKACETCGQLFQERLKEIKGLKMYELKPEQNTITVYFNPQKTSLQDIRTAISKLGYDADDLKADTEAYAKLDGCCKKS